MTIEYKHRIIMLFLNLSQSRLLFECEGLNIKYCPSVAARISKLEQNKYERSK